MPPVSTLEFDVHDLPMDVFDLTVSGLEVQTLTLGRGYDIVNGPFTSCLGVSGCVCGCGGGPDKPHADPDDDMDEE